MSINDYILIFSRSFLFVLATLLPIVNPPAVAPIFLTMTEGASASTRKLLAKRISINVFVMLTLAALFGNMVLSFFGLSLPIVRVGGGLLVVASAWQLVNAKDPDTNAHEKLVENYSQEKVKSSAFYPLTFPIACGPGSISAAITVGASFDFISAAAGVMSVSAMILAVISVSAILFFCLRFAARFLARLGTSGTAVFMRLSAFILLCIGVQIIWDGAHELIMRLFADIYSTYSRTSL